MNPAWCLNLDADDELGAPVGYTTKPRVSLHVKAQFALARALTEDDPVCERDALGPSHRVFCWCPTPSALRYLAKKRLSAVQGPPLEVLRQANHRRLGLVEAPEVLERVFVEPTDDWHRLLCEARAPSGSWRLKRAFGCAGRGQRRLTSTPSAHDLRWVEDAMKRGGLLRETEVMVKDEYSIHGYVDDKQLMIGQPVRFVSDRFGAPLAFESASLGESAWAREGQAAAESVASRLVQLGYFGPFGVDSFTWQERGGLEFNPVSDINARFTLAWSLGMGRHKLDALGKYSARARRG